MITAGSHSPRLVMRVACALAVVFNLVAAAFSWRRGLLYCSVPLLSAVLCGVMLLYFTKWGAHHKRLIKSAAVLLALAGAALAAVTIATLN